MLPSTTSSSARLSLTYITIGTLLVIWTGVWYVYLLNNTPTTNGPYYWCAGLVITGLAFLGIGLSLGQIGHSARRAEIPPEAVVTTPVVHDAKGHPVGAATPPGTVPAGPVPVGSQTVAIPATTPVSANNVAQPPAQATR